MRLADLLTLLDREQQDLERDYALSAAALMREAATKLRRMRIRMEEAGIDADEC